jgi:alpha-galactosidase
MGFAAEGLPASLRLDPATGIIAGTAPAAPGRVRITLAASNAAGRDERGWTLVVGPTLALTPPMGFNDWYTWYNRITQADMVAAADAMVASGLADVGYSYVNIDDCWMVQPVSDDPMLGGEARDAGTGAVRSNGRFPDMKGLADAIHERGLKAGLYTSPGRLTCAGFAGAYQHEAADAKQFADWGFDFLKYDWCSYTEVATGTGLEKYQKPYRLMGRLLAEQPRDIVFNLCQYGMGDVWTWGQEVGGHCWRTTGDLGLERATRLPGFYSVAFANAQHAEYAGPGAWNDPDYLLIGRVGNAHELSGPRPSGLTAYEEYSYMSLWCLMAAPLFYSGDILHLDPFTINVLGNSELIAIDQDELGRQGRVVRQTEDELVMAKPLADGSVAVGLFNLSESPRAVSASWAELGVTGRQVVRDCWHQVDLATAGERLDLGPIERHSVRVVRLQPEVTR